MYRCKPRRSMIFGRIRRKMDVLNAITRMIIQNKNTIRNVVCARALPMTLGFRDTDIRSGESKDV